MEEASDPKIVDRLKKLPPFDDEQPEEVPAVAPKEEETPAEEPKPEVEAEGEAKIEVKEEEVSEDEQKKRTQEQFEKLKEHNAELKRQLEAQKVKEPPMKNALDALIPDPQPITTNVIPTPQQYPNLSPKDIKDTFANLTDDQGYVDTGLLKETLVTLNQRAAEAEGRAAKAEEENKRNARRMDDFERKALMKQVHEMYPKLNPENVTSDDPALKFDPAFYDAFQGEVIKQWTTVGKEDVWSAGKKWSDILYGGDMRKAEKEKAEKAELAKKNINATSVKPTSTTNSFKDQDELIMATRKGKPGALAERLARAGQ